VIYTRKGKLILAAVVLAIIVVWAAVGKVRSARTNEPVIETEKAARGRIVSTVSASGILQPLTTIDIKSNAGGRVDTLSVDVGSVVKTGQVIARIDPTDTLTVLSQAEADLLAARAKVGQARESMALESQQSAAGIRQARSNYEAARVRLQQAEAQAEAQPSITKFAIAQAEAGYRSAQETLRQLKSAGVPQGTAQIRAAYNQAKASLDKAKRNYDRQKNLFDKGFIPASTLDSATLDYETAKADMDMAKARMSTAGDDYDAQVRAAQARLDQAKASFENAKANSVQDKIRNQDVAAAKAALRQAKASLDSALANSRQISIKAADIQSAGAQVVRNKASVDNARIQLNYTTVTAPRDGIILQKYVEAGTIVTSGKSSFAGTGAGTSIVQLGDLSKMYVLASVDETDIAQVRLGQTVDVQIDAYPEQRFTGKVTKIDPQTVTDQNVTTIPVKVQVVNASPTLKPGMNATCNFIVEKRDNVLLVPVEAVKERSGRHFITVLQGGKQVVRPVKTGLEGDETVEITAGLREGELVVTAVIGPMPKAQAGSPLGMRRPRGGGRGAR
jgi:HlyD family secretion protein